VRIALNASPPMRRGLIGLLLLCGIVLAVPNSASAFTSQPLWNCRASALYASVAGANRVEPIVANGNPSTAGNKSPDRAQCANEEAGTGNLPTPLSIPTTFVSAETATATTTIEPELGSAIDQKVTSTAKVEGLSLPLGGSTVILGLQGVTSTATGVCSAGKPVFTGTGNTDVTIGGQRIPLNGVLSGLEQILKPLNLIADVKFNEIIRDDNSITVRAAHIKILPVGGGAPLVDLIVAESRVVASADTCNPDKQIPGVPGKLCPTGSKYDATSGFCVIPAVVGGSGQIVVGRPFEGPSGGTVMGVGEAIKKYGNLLCLRGSGPKYAVVGTNKNDHITGTNGPDRILGLGGQDSLDGGRGNDCVEGNNGNDTVNGGIGNDRVYGGGGSDTMTGDLGKDHMDGGAGNDKVNGGSGADTLIGGVGRDIINAGYGADKVTAGSGNDVVNVAVQGPHATINCGSGRDKIRLNQIEKKHIKSCELTYVLADNKILR
jgi:hypothetical protein